MSTDLLSFVRPSVLLFCFIINCHIFEQTTFTLYNTQKEFSSTSENENPELYKNRGTSAMLQTFPLGEGLQCCRSSGGSSAVLQIFREEGLQWGRSAIQQRYSDDFVDTKECIEFMTYEKDVQCTMYLKLFQQSGFTWGLGPSPLYSEEWQNDSEIRKYKLCFHALKEIVNSESMETVFLKCTDDFSISDCREC